jgi:hypothetical protein
MRLVGRHALVVEAATVVAHLHAPLWRLLHFHPHLARAGVFAHVGQRFLHHVQHLDLHVGGQRHAVALDREVRRQAALVLELLQRRAQCGCDVFGARAGAEVHQQLAHVGQAFLHAGVEFAQRAFDVRGVLAFERAAQQADLDLQECEALGDRVVQLARQQAPLRRHRRLAFQRAGTSAWSAS